MVLRKSLVVALVLALARSASAHVVVVPVMPMGPYPSYYYPPPEHLEFNNQYYDLSLSGLQKLCLAHPDACTPAQREALEGFATRRTVGLVLLFTGVAAAIAGPVWTAASIRRDSTGTHANAVPLIVGLSAGVALPLTGGLIMPHRSELVDVINEMNAAHPETPVRINLGGTMSPLGSPGLMLGMNF